MKIKTIKIVIHSAKDYILKSILLTYVDLHVHSHICTYVHVRPTEGTIVSKTAIVTVNLHKASKLISGDETACMFAQLKGTRKQREQKNENYCQPSTQPHGFGTNVLGCTIITKFNFISLEKQGCGMWNVKLSLSKA